MGLMNSFTNNTNFKWAGIRSLLKGLQMSETGRCVGSLAFSRTQKIPKKLWKKHILSHVKLYFFVIMFVYRLLSQSARMGLSKKQWNYPFCVIAKLHSSYSAQTTNYSNIHQLKWIKYCFAIQNILTHTSQ
jgi:hypothetical protein